MDEPRQRAQYLPAELANLEVEIVQYINKPTKSLEKQKHFFSPRFQVLLYYVQQIGILSGVNLDFLPSFVPITDAFQTVYTPVNKIHCMYNPKSTWLPAVQTVLLRLMSPCLVVFLLVVIWSVVYRYAVLSSCGRCP